MSKKPKSFTAYIGFFRGKPDFIDTAGHYIGDRDYYATELFKHKSGAKQWYGKKNIAKVRVKFL